VKLKSLIYPLLFVFLYLLSLPVAGQRTVNKPISPSKMCHYIHKQRTKKVKKKFSLSKPQNDMSRISYSPDDIHYERPSFKAAPVKKEDILSVPELVVSNKKFNPPSGPLPTPVNQRHSEIRELVKEKISNGEANEPILESLYFITDEAEFAYVDFDPFLIAVEFALQGKMVLVEGHTDDRGSDEHNLQLSMSRVRQIEALMRDIGVPEENVSVIGYGESMPKFDNSTEEGQQKNRRVDFKIF